MTQAPAAEHILSGSRRLWVPVAAALVVGGWGGNQFTPLSVVYRVDRHWEALAVVLMFTTYLVGLVPGLLLGVPLARSHGRRRVVRLALALTAAASALLATATIEPSLVHLSRLVSGAAAGIIVSAGALWLQELSSGTNSDAGASRVVLATGAGFAVGPLAAGAMTEWLPQPMVTPCLVHSVVALLVLAATRRVPETSTTPGPAVSMSRGRRDRWSAVTHPRFIGVVLPASPAVFAGVTVAYVVLPPLVADRVHHYAPLFSGFVAAVTLSVGLAVQPVAARIDRPGTARSILVAVATVVAGLALGAVAVARVSPVLVVAAAVVLGAGYGLVFESGLAEVRRLASPSSLPTAAAFFQGVAHSGFLAPLILAVTAGSATYPTLLTGLALIGLVVLATAGAYSRLTQGRATALGRAPAAGAPLNRESTGSTPWEE